LGTETKGKGTVQQRAIHEVKEFAILALYLYITLGAVIMMKTAVLHTVGIEAAPWGIAIIKALVLAKFMLFGFAMKLGQGKTTGPLIWPTLQMALAFLALLIVMTVVEEIVVGLFHHRSIAASFGELFGLRLEETLAGYLIMLLVLIPFFAFRVLSNTLGEGRLERMFFVEREPIKVR
jgi:cytochrome bd-type quinol oxidase subunit 2